MSRGILIFLGFFISGLFLDGRSVLGCFFFVFLGLGSCNPSSVRYLLSKSGGISKLCGRTKALKRRSASFSCSGLKSSSSVGILLLDNWSASVFKRPGTCRRWAGYSDKVIAKRCISGQDDLTALKNSTARQSQNIVRDFAACMWNRNAVSPRSKPSISLRKME